MLCRDPSWSSSSEIRKLHTAESKPRAESHGQYTLTQAPIVVMWWEKSSKKIQVFPDMASATSTAQDTVKIHTPQLIAYSRSSERHYIVTRIQRPLTTLLNVRTLTSAIFSTSGGSTFDIDFFPNTAALCTKVVTTTNFAFITLESMPKREERGEGREGGGEREM